MSIGKEDITTDALHYLINAEPSITIINTIMCRLCQQHLGVVEIDKKDQLCDIIESYLGIEIKTNLEDTKYPQSICINCEKILHTILVFQRYCWNVNKQLKNLLYEKEKFNCEEIDSTDNVQVVENIKEVKSEALRTEDLSPKGKIELRNEKVETKSLKVENNDIDEGSPFGYTNNESNDSDYDPFAEETTDAKKLKKKSIYVCQVTDCGKVFNRKSIFFDHRFIAHQIKEFLCTVCGKSFGRSNSLEAHERIHLPTKQFVCSLCDMSFAQSANLKTHVRVHHEGHRFYCPLCGKGFLTNTTLKRHELIHIGVKDFKCSSCPAAFYTKRELTKHRRYHQDVRAYFCTICYKTYIEKHHLTIHMRSHTGERPYLCDVTGCEKTFIESQKLRRHKKNVHRMNI